MNIICVDDEDLVLRLTVSFCREMPSKPNVQGFNDVFEALEYLDGHQVDIALLDINMPGMNGIQLAAKIKEKQPAVSIIFLTGYSEYAVDAFQLHASGYILKPVSREKLYQEISYAYAPHQHSRIPGHVYVKTFGEFDVLVDGKLVVFSRSRAKELLAYLIDRQGGSITRLKAFAVLWEDSTYDRRMQKQLDVVIRSLKSTLEEYGIEDIFEMNKGAMRIKPEKIDCDLYRFINGDIEAINSYRGEYMSAYSWASLTEAYMDRANQRI